MRSRPKLEVKNWLTLSMAIVVLDFLECTLHCFGTQETFSRKAQQRSGILQDQKCMRLSPGHLAAVARMAMLMALR